MYKWRRPVTLSRRAVLSIALRHIIYITTIRYSLLLQAKLLKKYIVMSNMSAKNM